MENTARLNPNLGNMTLAAYLIEKVHRCADCPIRQQAIKHPHSAFARLHRWHKAWWPGWKAHEARTCALARK